MAALYALGSLTQHEARSFEIHIREGCSICEAELHKYERTAAGIGFAVDEIDAPDYIRDLLSARIERESQAGAAAVAPDGSDAAKYATGDGSAAAVQSALFKSERKKSGIFVWTCMIFFAVLAILAAYAWKSAQGTIAQLRGEVSRAEATADNLQNLLDSEKGRPADLEQILTEAGLPGTRIARMKGQSVAPSASGAVFWDAQQDHCLFFGLMPLLPQGKAYQLWVKTSSEIVPAGLIKSNPTGRIFVSVSIPEGIVNPDAFIITLEPESGARIPSPPYYAVGQLD